MSRETCGKNGGKWDFPSFWCFSTLTRSNQANKAQGPLSHAILSPQRLRLILLSRWVCTAVPCTRPILLLHVTYMRFLLILRSAFLQGYLALVLLEGPGPKTS
jgi:hypothetical protein